MMAPRRGRPLDRPGRVKRILAAILALGWGAAIVLFFTARPPGADSLAYDPTSSKSYLRDMELYGGKGNVLASQFREWVSGLFHGQSLAFTVAILTILVAAGVWFFAMPLPPAPRKRGR
jgi:hypothetical protein